LDEKTKIGAVVSKPHMEKILSYVELAKQEGGKVLCGGKQATMLVENLKMVII
jgi:aminomuconate-semialdehyde/2-hydroxymuconate-6-semialdehyde dehydrogenase